MGIFLKLAYALTLLLSLSSTSSAITTTNEVMQGCSIESLSLVQCMDVVNANDKVFTTSGSCCTFLNKAVETGFHCLCSLLDTTSHSPLQDTPLFLQLSNCFISAPPLTLCRALVPEVQQPPEARPLQVLNPPPPPQQPMEQLPQPSVPNNLLLPPPPPPPLQVQFPMNSDSDTNSTAVSSMTRSDCLISNGNTNQDLLLSTAFLAFTLYFYMV